MQITKTFKFQDRDFGSRGFSVTLAHDEIGLPAPTDVASFQANLKEMTRIAETVLVIEEGRYGLIPSTEEATAKLRPWLPDSQTPTSSPTEPG